MRIQNYLFNRQENWKSKYFDVCAEKTALEWKLQQIEEDYSRLLEYYQKLSNYDLLLLGNHMFNAIMYLVGDKNIPEDLDDLLISWRDIADEQP